MTNGEGFVRLRRGILEHLRDRRLRPVEFAAFLTILLVADFRTGRWQGSARSLARLMGISSRYARTLLGRLEGMGYVMRGSTQPPGTYAIGIKKYFAGCVSSAHSSSEGAAPQFRGAAPQFRGAAPGSRVEN